MNPLFQVAQDIDRICRTRGLNPNNPEQEALILDVLKVKWDLKDPAAPVLLQPGSKAVVDGFLGVELDPADRSPEKTLEMVKDIVSQSRTQFMPWG